MRLIWLAMAFLGLILLLHAPRTTAQSSTTVTLSSPDTSNFPHLTAYLDVHDASGGFIHGLTSQDVTIQENGNQLPVTGLIEIKPGVQFVLAISPGSTFSIRDATGTARYEYLLQGLLAGSWAKQPGGIDDLSLITVGGPQITHSSDPATLYSSLESYRPEDTNSSSSLEALATALQVASDPIAHHGMERAILFITPPQGTEASQGLQSILSNANQQNIHISVWLVAPQESFTLPEIDLLRNLAAQTHGTFFAFSHSENVPDLEALLEPLRYIYQLGYDSQAKTSGTQHVSAQVSIGSEQVTSQIQPFEINLQPPMLEVLNPPAEIIRIFPKQPTPDTSNALSDLQPVEELLSLRVSFPDGHVRPITRTSLLVDGVEVTHNTTPPFEQLVWDLRSYIQDGTHTVRIEAEDNLGLIGQTADLSIKIRVPSATQEVAAVVSQKRLLVIGITVFISASVLVLVLILGGRIRPRLHPGQARPLSGSGTNTRMAGYRERLRQLRDPVTQPVKIVSTLAAKSKAHASGWKERLPWHKRKENATPALAYLIPLVGTDEPTLPTPLKIIADQSTLGSNAQKASLVIADPSIEGLHATIQREGNQFTITDAGSVAGTWVNFERVTQGGRILAHADIIHLGRVGFRFNLTEPGTPRRIIITPLEPHP